MDANITVPSLLTPAIITSIKQMKAEQSVKKKKKKKMVMSLQKIHQALPVLCM